MTTPIEDIMPLPDNNLHINLTDEIGAPFKALPATAEWQWASILNQLHGGGYSIVGPEVKARTEKVEKPPLGVKPRHIVDSERERELSAAFYRYLKARVPPPPEWMEEYNEIYERLEQ